MQSDPDYAEAYRAKQKKLVEEAAENEKVKKGAFLFSIILLTVILASWYYVAVKQRLSGLAHS